MPRSVYPNYRSAARATRFKPGGGAYRYAASQVIQSLMRGARTRIRMAPQIHERRQAMYRRAASRSMYS